MSELIKSGTSWNFRTVKTLMQGTQIDDSPIEKSSTTRMFSMPTLIKKIKPVVLVKYEFAYREKLKSGFLEFSDYQDTDSREKNNNFLVGYSCTSAVFSIEILMEEIELVLVDN